MVATVVEEVVSINKCNSIFNLYVFKVIYTYSLTDETESDMISFHYFIRFPLIIEGLYLLSYSSLSLR